MGRYRLRYFFDFGGGCLWAANKDAQDRFDYCVDLNCLSLTAETIKTADALGAWFDRSLNWEYPPDPGPWRQEECDRFNKATDELLSVMRTEFDIVNEQKRMAEDPDLDAYLANPRKVSRRHR